MYLSIWQVEVDTISNLFLYTSINLVRKDVCQRQICLLDDHLKRQTEGVLEDVWDGNL